jgi:pyruvate formate lyase activating enzyme
VLKRVTSQGKWIDGICVTGGEPTIHIGLPALLEKIHEAGIKVKLDTNGTQPEILQHLISHKLVDHVAMDVKAPLDDAAYARNAGVFVPTGLIKESIKGIMRSGVSHTFRCTVAPTLLSEADIYDLAQGLKALALECNVTTSRSLVIQNFNPADPLDPAYKDVKPYDEKAFDCIQTEVNRILS